MYIYIYVYICIYICIYVYICIYIILYTHIHTYTFLFYIYIHTYKYQDYGHTTDISGYITSINEYGATYHHGFIWPVFAYQRHPETPNHRLRRSACLNSCASWEGQQLKTHCVNCQFWIIIHSSLHFFTQWFIGFLFIAQNLGVKFLVKPWSLRDTKRRLGPRRPRPFRRSGHTRVFDISAATMSGSLKAAGMYRVPM